MRNIIGLSAVVALMSMTGCATITKGTQDTVTIQSVPEAAKVTFTEKLGKLANQYCSTPCTIELNRKYTYGVSFEKEGYKPVTGLLEPKFSTDGAVGMAGNVLLGGIVGAAIDGSTGAMNDLKPNPMVAQLAAEGSDDESYIEGVMGVLTQTDAADGAAAEVEEDAPEVVEAAIEDAEEAAESVEGTAEDVVEEAVEAVEGAAS